MTCSGRRLHRQKGPPPPGLRPGPALQRGEQPEALTAGRGRGRKGGIWEQGGSYRGTSTLACDESSLPVVMPASGAANFVAKGSPMPTHGRPCGSRCFSLRDMGHGQRERHAAQKGERAGERVAACLRSSTSVPFTFSLQAFGQPQAKVLAEPAATGASVGAAAGTGTRAGVAIWAAPASAADLFRWLTNCTLTTCTTCLSLSCSWFPDASLQMPTANACTSSQQCQHGVPRTLRMELGIGDVR